MEIGKVDNGTRSLFIVDDMYSPGYRADWDADPRIAIELPEKRIGLNADEFAQLMHLCEVAIATLTQRQGEVKC